MRRTGSVVHRVGATAVAALLSSGCLGFVPRSDRAASLGLTNAGVLVRGVALPDRGHGYVRARPGEPTRWGTPELVSALEKAASAVEEAFPGTQPLRVGDLSYPGGGRHPRHNSHRSGRDVDVIFYSLDAAGHPVRGRGWLAYDRFGVAREGRTPAGAGSGDVFFFDDARNWHFVRTLLLDPDAHVQWIFCSTGLKARLLRYAASHEPSREAIFRATWVLHEPTAARRHDDHFHVRVACSAEQRVLGCENRGPLWPWIRQNVEKLHSPAPEARSDAMLVQALMADASGP